MKTILCIVLAAITVGACKSNRQDPLVGKWKLSSATTTPTATAPAGPAVGTIYTFRQDSTLSIGADPARLRYRLQKLPEGMFLSVGAAPEIRYRIIAMTPAELGLQQDRGESLLNLRLEFQP